MKKTYGLPALDYDYGQLSPFLSKELLTLHHDKHHQKYIDNANSILEKIDKARENQTDIALDSLAKDLSYNVGGHVLHSLFWKNLTPDQQNKEMPDDLKLFLEKEFTSVENFKKEFSLVASKTQGSGWGALVYCPKTQRPFLMQIQNHHLNIYPGFKLLMVLDVWEHAFYLDYQTDKKSYIESFWDFVNWDQVAKRLKAVKK